MCESNQKQGITSKSDGLKVRGRAAFLMHWISKLLMHKHEASRMGLSGRATVSAEARRKIGEADRRSFFSAGPLCRTIFSSFLNKHVLISRSIEFFELCGLLYWSSGADEYDSDLYCGSKLPTYPILGLSFQNF